MRIINSFLFVCCMKKRNFFFLVFARDYMTTLESFHSNVSLLYKKNEQLFININK